MNKILLFLAVSVFLLSGCANPTRSYHPLELPDRNKGEVVKYEGVAPKTKFTGVAYEAKTGDSLSLFYAQRFCYDAQNDYLVFPNSADEFSYTPKDGLYLAVPRTAVKLCKDGKVKNNSFYSRNHALRGASIGAIGAGGLVAIATFPVFLILGSLDATAASVIYLGMVGGSAVVGGGIGMLVGIMVNGSVVDEIEDACAEYFTEEELAKYLNSNLCF